MRRFAAQLPTFIAFRRSLQLLFPLLLSFVSTLALANFAWAAPTVTVLSPKAGSTPGSPVFYEAYATSPSCANGISAMRIYSAPYQAAYTTYGAHIETFIPLAPGSYNTVVQAWDNCGGVAKTNVTVQVGTTAGVTVFLPSSSTANTPFHLAASAQSPGCAAGIYAMRLYTANGASPYTVYSNQLNTFAGLARGVYWLTIQAWDNCGNVYKSDFKESGGLGADGYLYAVNPDPGNVAEFTVNSGTLTNPNGSGNPPLFAAGSGANSIAIDPGGWFAYVTTSNGIVGYQIDQSNGALWPMPGSPFALSSTGPTDVAIDPNGNFLFVAYNTSNTFSVYRINRSSGAITETATATGSGGVYAVSADYTGQYVYAINQNFESATIWGYRIDVDNGTLTAVPGSPYALANGFYGSALASTQLPLSEGESVWQSSLYAATEAPGDPLYGFVVNYSTGALTAVPGSPFSMDQIATNPQSLLADSLGVWIWGAADAPTYPTQSWFDSYQIGQGGTLMNSTESSQTGTISTYAIAEDGSGWYLYGSGANCVGTVCTGEVTSWVIGDGGAPGPIVSGPLNTGPTTNVTALGVARQFGD